MDWDVAVVAISLLGSGVAALPWLSAAAAARVAIGFGSLGVVTAVSWVVSRLTGVIESHWFVVISALFITFLSVVIQLFSARQLRADTRQRWFVCWVNIVTAGSLGVVVAPSIVWFAVAWTSVGVGLVMLLATYPRLSQARQGVRRTAVNLLIGDAALWTAVLIVVVRHGGDIRWDALGTTVSAMGAAAQLVLAVLLVTAALARSGQIPFHTWLPMTLAAPTPVSAIMHAGIVNAATFLVIRFSSAISHSVPAVLVLFVLGAATMLVGAAGYLVRPDLKGRLVASTTAQMGFMVMTLGVGAYTAAVFHLIGHGFYKSNLFLRSGNQINDLRNYGRLPLAHQPHRARRIAAAVIAAIGPTTAIVVTTFVINPQVGASAVVLAGYGCITGAVFLYPWLLREGLSAALRVVLFVAVVVAGVIYAVTVHAAQLVLGNGVPAPYWAVPAWALLPPLILVALISLLPTVSADRWPVLYGLVSGLAGSPGPRIRVTRSRRDPQASHPSLAQEIA